MPDRIYNVLFLCTGNSARSIMAESVLRAAGERYFRAFSAGSVPKESVHPLAITTLEENGFSSAGLLSKNMLTFLQDDAPVMDLVITVCDRASKESCAVWPGEPVLAHWGIEDPAAVTGGDAEKKAAFAQALRFLRLRIAALVGLRMGLMTDVDKLRERMREIGRQEGATPHTMQRRP